MVRSELIKSMEELGLFTPLLQKGIISLKIMSYKVYYERFKQEEQRFGKVQALTNTADEFRVTEKTIRNAVNFMES